MQRRIEAMVVIAVLAAVCIASSGCLRTTTRIVRTQDGAVLISSPKDVTIDSLTWVNAGSENTLEVRGYSSSASVAALQAQRAAIESAIGAAVKAAAQGAMP